LKLYCVSFNVPLWVEIVPLPSFRLPCQTADALRSIVFLLFCFFVFRLYLITVFSSMRWLGSKEVEIDSRPLVSPDAGFEMCGFIRVPLN
jgi:hypothetical protein